MKKLCSVDVGGKTLDYLLDVGKRSNAYLSVKDGVVTVRMPYGGTQRGAEELILSHREWLDKKIKQSAERSRLPESFSGGEDFSLLGKKRRLSVIRSAKYRPPELDEEELRLYVGETMTDADVSRLFFRYISDLCEQRVRQAFEKNTEKLGLAPRKVTIKKMTSRWGSCSSNGSISINIDVICFGQECIDYVVIHELCHLKYMDHSERFWALVSTCCPDYKKLRERMKH